jgi:polar amino acid transport system substrate-binding protein
MVFAYIDEPPFVAPAETPWPTGCDAEVAALVLEALGIDAPEARLTTFAELLPGVAAGRWAFATALFITEQRSRLVRFSRPIWALPDGLLTRSDDVSRLGTYEAIAADATARVGAVRDQVQAQTALGAGVPRARVIGYPTPEAVVAALLDGEVDAYASVATAHRGLLGRHPDPRLAISDLGDPKHAGRAGSDPALGAFSFAHEDHAFAVAFDAALGSFLGSPAHAAIVGRYGFTLRDGLAWG